MALGSWSLLLITRLNTINKTMSFIGTGLFDPIKLQLDGSFQSLYLTYTVFILGTSNSIKKLIKIERKIIFSGPVARSSQFW